MNIEIKNIKQYLHLIIELYYKLQHTYLKKIILNMLKEVILMLKNSI